MVRRLPQPLPRVASAELPPGAPFTPARPLSIFPRTMPTDSSSLRPPERVLGLDPGTRVAGYGILEVQAGRGLVVLSHGAIRFPPSPLAARLETLFLALQELIRVHAPTVLSIERVFHGKNFQSILKVGEARGVAVLAAQLSGLAIREYTPAMIKKAATGNGNADKGQVQRMMGRLLRLDAPPEPVDASDALAAAFCHTQQARLGVEKTKIPSRRSGTSLLNLVERGGKHQPATSNVIQRTDLKGLDLPGLLRSGKARVVTRPRPRARRVTPLRTEES